MKWISIQIQPENSPEIDKGEVIDALTGTELLLEIFEGDDDGPYINLNLKVKHPMTFWLEQKSRLMGCAGFNMSSIVTCEGENGWVDYLLLHHFDPGVKCDEISSSR